MTNINVIVTEKCVHVWEWAYESRYIAKFQSPLRDLDRNLNNAILLEQRTQPARNLHEISTTNFEDPSKGCYAKILSIKSPFFFFFSFLRNFKLNVENSSAT